MPCWPGERSFSPFASSSISPSSHSLWIAGTAAKVGRHWEITAGLEEGRAIPLGGNVGLGQFNPAGRAVSWESFGETNQPTHWVLSGGDCQPKATADRWGKDSVLAIKPIRGDKTTPQKYTWAPTRLEGLLVSLKFFVLQYIFANIYALGILSCKGSGETSHLTRLWWLWLLGMKSFWNLAWLSPAELGPLQQAEGSVKCCPVQGTLLYSPSANCSGGSAVKYLVFCAWESLR